MSRHCVESRVTPFDPECDTERPNEFGYSKKRVTNDITDGCSKETACLPLSIWLRLQKTPELALL